MVSRQEIQKFVDQVVEHFNPLKIILFGSYAYGIPTEDSDVDLLVVMRHQGSSVHVATRIRLACPRKFSMDLLVRSPAQIRKRIKIGDPFMNEITTKGLVMHEADYARVGR